MYARAFRTWFGGRAVRLAPDHVKKLQKRGDLAGVEIWMGVAIELERLRTRTPTPRTPPKRFTGTTSKQFRAERGRATADTRASLLRAKGGDARRFIRSEHHDRSVQPTVS
jgi:hypothetical protein